MTALSHRTGGQVSAEEAAEHLAELLEHVREGASYTIMSEGRAIARLEPALEPTLEEPPPDERTEDEREAAWQRLLDHLDTVKAVDSGKWTRDELYER